MLVKVVVVVLVIFAIWILWNPSFWPSYAWMPRMEWFNYCISDWKANKVSMFMIPDDMSDNCLTALKAIIHWTFPIIVGLLISLVFKGFGILKP